MSPARRAFGLLALVVAIVALDRWTKHWAVFTLAGTPRRSFLGDTIRLDYAENAGAFLSLGADWPAPVRTAVFTGVTALILLGTVAFAIRIRFQGRQAWGLALLFAGGVSNWIDRTTAGSTVDFMNVGIGRLRTGIFNVADVAIMAGIAVLLATWRARPAT